MSTRWKQAVALLSLGASVLIGSATVAYAQNNCASGGNNGGPAVALRTLDGALPLSFEPNVGQVDGRVKFLARGRGYGVYLTATEAALTIGKPVGDAATTRSFQSDVLRMTLVGANPAPRVAGRDPLPGKANSFGPARASWRTDVPMYAKVKYEAVYPGVDLVYYGNQRRLEYDFVVAPGADPRAIRLAFTRATSLRVDDDGALVLALAGGDIRQPAPFVYQETDGIRASIPARYVIKDRHAVAFEVGAYDRSRPLVIDPTLVYSTYLGGSCSIGDSGTGVAVDSGGNAYVTGYTTSGDFPVTTGAAPSAQFSTYVTKINAAGTALVYSTVLSASDGRGIAIDAAGNAYVAGGGGPGAPILNGYQPFFGGAGVDGFVAKLGPTGSLLYSSYIGGGGNDLALGVAADAAGHAYVVGFHNSADAFRTTSNALLPHNPSDGCDGGGFTGFLVKVDTNATGDASLLYATNIAGAGGGTNAATGIAADAAGNAYVSGATSSVFFPTTPGAVQPSFNGSPSCFAVSDAYVVKVNTAPATCTPATFNGTDVACQESLVYGTYLGGSGDDFANGIAIDAAGNAYVTGATASTNFPTTAGAPQSTNAGGYDAFAAKLNATASAVVSSTYLGGSLDDIGTRIAVNAAGNAFVAGVTSSSNFHTTPNALQAANAGGTDAFVTKLSTTGALDYSSYLGGAANDRGNDVAVDGAGNVYVVGITSSTNFATTPGVLQPTFPGGGTDAFVTKISLATPQEQIQSVATTLASVPSLTGVQLGSATSKLDAATRALASGNTTSATNQLNALTNQVRAWIHSGRVSASDGQALIDSVNGVITQISH